jgi:hypothetical protein
MPNPAMLINALASGNALCHYGLTAEENSARRQIAFRINFRIATRTDFVSIAAVARCIWKNSTQTE